MNPLEEAERIARSEIDEVLETADKAHLMVILRRVAMAGMDSTLNALTQPQPPSGSPRPVL